MSQFFYRAFEDKYRGSRDLIKSRLEFYLPFLVPLRDFFKGQLAVMDLGCGRGEWIELLNENGFEAAGVDLDDGMLAACSEKGLDVRKEDAVTALQGLADDSQVAVTAFHLVEHVDFPVLETLVREALRVLRPGGLLILETPNPENLIVGATSFYRDPTHHRPLPPELLAFVPEFIGFERTKILRLQEDPHLHTENPLSLYAVFHGPSPDYSIIAQKAGPGDVLTRFDSLFSREFGLTLGTLADRYHVFLEERLAHAITVADHSLNQSEHALDWSRQSLTIAQQVDAVANEALQKAHEALNALHITRTEILARAEAAEQRVVDLEHSLSWRITAPMRRASSWLRHVKLLFRHRTKQILVFSVQRAAQIPGVKPIGRALLQRSPRGAAWLSRVMVQATRSSNNDRDFASSMLNNSKKMTALARRIDTQMQQISKPDQ